MITISGKWYAGHTSEQVEAQLEVYKNKEVRVRSLPAKDLLAQGLFESLSISARLADTARSLRFPDGQLFETKDNNTVDKLQKEFNPSTWPRLLYKLETYKSYILLSLGLFIVLCWLTLQYGVPLTSKIIATYLPGSLYEQVDAQTLKILENRYLKPTQLKASTVNDLQKHFKPLIQKHSKYNLQVIFKHADKLGANAFALPGGTVIFTDEMVQLSKNKQELTAVLAHETGHVVLSHGMRKLVQKSLLSFALLAITGDASGTSEIFLTLPVLLTQLSYSRDFELEADQYALTLLQNQGIDPRHFADILRRIDAQYQTRDKDQDAHKWSHYLSTHPLTDKRLKPFEQSREE